DGLAARHDGSSKDANIISVFVQEWTAEGSRRNARRDQQTLAGFREGVLTGDGTVGQFSSGRHHLQKDTTIAYLHRIGRRALQPSFRVMLKLEYRPILPLIPS